MVPGGGGDVPAAVLFPVDIWFVAQDAGTLFPDRGHGHKGADIEADAVVEVRLPAERLLLEGFPADEDVIRRFTFKDQLKLLFQTFRRVEFLSGAVDAVGDVLPLPADPVAQIGVDQGFEVFAVEFMVVDQGRKAVGQAVPELPNEGAMVEELTVLDKKFVSEPVLQGFTGAIDGGQQPQRGLLQAGPKLRGEILDAARVCEAKAVDVGVTSITFEVTGPPDRLADFLQLMSTYGVTALAKSGRIALARDQKTAKTQSKSA